MKPSAKRNQSNASVGLCLAVLATVLALVALVGPWWGGQFQSEALGVSGRGDISLWSLHTSDLGLELDLKSACKTSLWKVCERILALRLLIGCSLGFAAAASLSAVATLCNLSGTCKISCDLLGLVSACLFAAASCGCMIAALAVGASPGARQQLTISGSLGAAPCCAIVHVVMSFVVFVIFGISACSLRREHKQFQSEASEARAEL